MPTVQLFSATDDPQGERNVRAPGGYESQYLHATSADGRTHLIAGLHYGHPLDGQYVRRYLRYRMTPTRVPPPVPRAHPSVSLMTMHEGRIVRQVLERRAWSDEGDRLQLSGTDLIFRPRLWLGPAGDEVVDGAHHLIVTAPLCDVVGTLGSMAFEGVGCRVYRLGTRWPGETGGLINGASVEAARVRVVSVVAGRVHAIEMTPEACQHVERDVSIELPALCERIEPSRLASWLIPLPVDHAHLNKCSRI